MKYIGTFSSYTNSTEFMIVYQTKHFLLFSLQSHACSQARWVGVCISYPEVVAGVQMPVGGAAGAGATSCAAAAANQLRLAQELCSRLEQLSTSTASKSGRI